MSVQKKWERVLHSRFGMGHASWPVFGSPMRIGDIGRLDGGLFRRSQSAESIHLNLNAAGHRKGPGAALELSFGVTTTGTLKGAAHAGVPAGSIELCFDGSSSFWFYAAEFAVEEVDAPETLGREVSEVLQASGRGLAPAERIVYRLVRVTSGTLLASQSHEAHATVGLRAGLGRAVVEVRAQSESLLKTELSADGEPAVIAYDLLRVGAQHVRVGV